MVLDPSGGVRAARKLQTRQALARAAIGIVGSEGIDALTADRLAAAAGVSRRTVFNYFPHLEDVLIAGIQDMTAASIESFVARPADERLRDSVRAALADLVESDVMAQVVDLERAATGSSATRRILREFHEIQTANIEAGLRDRIGDDADEIYAAALAAAAGAVLSAVVRHTVAAHPTEEAAALSRRLVPLMQDGLDLLFTGFDESRARPRGARTLED